MAYRSLPMPDLDDRLLANGERVVWLYTIGAGHHMLNQKLNTVAHIHVERDLLAARDYFWAEGTKSFPLPKTRLEGVTTLEEAKAVAQNMYAIYRGGK